MARCNSISSCFGRFVFALQSRCFFALLFNQRLLGNALIAIPLSLQKPFLQPPLQPLNFGIHLPQGSALVGAFALRCTPLLALQLQNAREFGQRVRQRSGGSV